MRRQKASTSYHGRCRRQPPTRVPRRAAAAAGQQGEAGVLHLVEVADALQADDQGEDAGQQAARASVPYVVGEALPGRGQPVEGLAHQQEGAGVLRACREKGGAGRRPAWHAGRRRRRAPAASAAAGRRRAGTAVGAAGRGRWSRPYFLRNLYRATRETRTPKVGSMKSIRSARLASGWLRRKLGDGAGVAGQEFAVGPAVQAVVGLLDGFLGGEALLARGGGAADAEQAGDLGDLEASAAVEQEMAEQARGVVVVALALAEAEGGLEQGVLLGVRRASG